MAPARRAALALICAAAALARARAQPASATSLLPLLQGVLGTVDDLSYLQFSLPGAFGPSFATTQLPAVPSLARGRRRARARPDAMWHEPARRPAQASPGTFFAATLVYPTTNATVNGTAVAVPSTAAGPLSVLAFAMSNDASAISLYAGLLSHLTSQGFVICVPAVAAAFGTQADQLLSCAAWLSASAANAGGGLAGHVRLGRYGLAGFGTGASVALMAAATGGSAVGVYGAQLVPAAAAVLPSVTAATLVLGGSADTVAPVASNAAAIAAALTGAPNVLAVVDGASHCFLTTGSAGASGSAIIGSLLSLPSYCVASALSSLPAAIAGNSAAVAALGLGAQDNSQTRVAAARLAALFAAYVSGDAAASPLVWGPPMTSSGVMSYVAASPRAAAAFSAADCAGCSAAAVQAGGPLAVGAATTITLSGSVTNLAPASATFTLVVTAGMPAASALGSGTLVNSTLSKLALSVSGTALSTLLFPSGLVVTVTPQTLQLGAGSATARGTAAASPPPPQPPPSPPPSASSLLSSLLSALLKGRRRRATARRALLAAPAASAAVGAFSVTVSTASALAGTHVVELAAVNAADGTTAAYAELSFTVGATNVSASGARTPLTPAQTGAKLAQTVQAAAPFVQTTAAALGGEVLALTPGLRGSAAAAGAALGAALGNATMAAGRALALPTGGAAGLAAVWPLLTNLYDASASWRTFATGSGPAASSAVAQLLAAAAQQGSSLSQLLPLLQLLFPATASG